MRRFLVIVLLSYFIAYFYLETQFWSNSSSSYYENAATISPKAKGTEKPEKQISQKTYAYNTKSADLKLLSE
ncbi:MAG TPA: hypothetical protein VNI52_01710 [Sphingobacteriaceae bacterium]|nr:hypothetical protein [Sphingobacteriaceae bacterium]